MSFVVFGYGRVWLAEVGEKKGVEYLCDSVQDERFGDFGVEVSVVVEIFNCAVVGAAYLEALEELWTVEILVGIVAAVYAYNAPVLAPVFVYKNNIRQGAPSTTTPKYAPLIIQLIPIHSLRPQQFQP